MGDGGAAEVVEAPKLKADAAGLGASSFFSAAAPKLKAGAGEAGAAVEAPKLNEVEGAGAGEAAGLPKLKAVDGAFAGVSSFLEAPKPPKEEVVAGVSSFLAGSTVLPNLKPEVGAGDAGAGVAPKLLKGDDCASGWLAGGVEAVDAPKLKDVEAVGAGAVDENEKEDLGASGCVVSGLLRTKSRSFLCTAGGRVDRLRPARLASLYLGSL